MECSVHSLSRVGLSASSRTAARQASLSITNSLSFLRLMSVESVMPSISSSDVPFSSRLQSFPASGSFPVSQFSVLGGQSIGASASASVLSMNTQGWFPEGLTRLISLLCKALSRVFSSTTVRKHQFLGLQPSLWSNSHTYMTAEKTVALTIQTFVGKVMSLLFNILSRYITAFLPRSKCLLIELHVIILNICIVKSLIRVQLFATPWTVAYQAPLFMGFSRQGYWSGLPFPSPGYEIKGEGNLTEVKWKEK